MTVTITVMVTSTVTFRDVIVANIAMTLRVTLFRDVVAATPYDPHHPFHYPFHQDAKRR